MMEARGRLARAAGVLQGSRAETYDGGGGQDRRWKNAGGITVFFVDTRGEGKDGEDRVRVQMTGVVANQTTPDFEWTAQL